MKYCHILLIGVLSFLINLNVVLNILQAAKIDAEQAGGPLGRYAARVTVAGIDGTLIKCEMGTTHTYLIFRADDGAADDMVIILSIGMIRIPPHCDTLRWNTSPLISISFLPPNHRLVS